MEVAAKAKAVVNTLTQEVSILHEYLKELGELLEVEECTPAECEALLRARKTLFELEDEVCQVLYAIKGRSEEYRERLARSIRDAVDDVIRFLDALDETLPGAGCDGAKEDERRRKN
jgi:hypothetical protein